MSSDSLFIAFQEALAGRYSLERELGRGGMGIVYLAREVRLDRLVAIKLLPPELAAQEHLRDRFLREARTAARLSQPNIVPIFAVDDVSDFVFYAMAYVEGETLTHRVTTRGPIPPHDAAKMLREIAWALAYAHAHDVVHRDVKPDNILIEHGTDRALVTDFGIARVTQAGGVTGVGEVLGTPEFMSPEQASAEHLDGRSDLYSLGVVAYYMLSGKLPFSGGNAAKILAQHLTTPAPSLASAAHGVPATLCQAVDRCLEKDPAKRFASGEEMAQAVGASLETSREMPVPLRVYLRQMERNHRSLLSGGVLVAVMVLPPTLGLAAEGYGPWGVFLPIAGYVALMGGLGIAAFASPARKLLRAGYGFDDSARALNDLLKTRREELAFEFGPNVPRVFNLGMKAALVIGATSVIVNLASPRTLALGGWPGVLLGVGGFFGSVILALLSLRRVSERRDLNTEWRAKIGRSRFARWVFRMAGFRLPHVVVAAASRPTELALGAAADALFHELPKEIRKEFAELPSVIKKLEARAQTIRERVAAVNKSIADAGSSARGGAERHDAFLTELRTEREQAQQRLGEVVAALETIRLDLLRLRAGTGKIDSITADLTRALEMGEHADRLILAQREIDAALAEGR